MGGTMDILKGAYGITKGVVKLGSGAVITSPIWNTIRNMYFNPKNSKQDIAKAVDLSFKDVGDIIKKTGLAKGEPEGFMAKNMGGMAYARKKGMGLEMAEGGIALKLVPSDKKGLKKLPKKVRNKMGYMKKGGAVKKRAKSSSKKSRGTGAAIRGTKFKGVF